MQIVQVFTNVTREPICLSNFSESTEIRIEVWMHEQWQLLSALHPTAGSTQQRLGRITTELEGWFDHFGPITLRIVDANPCRGQLPQEADGTQPEVRCVSANRLLTPLASKPDYPNAERK